MGDTLVTLTDEDWQTDVLDARGPVLVDFWAEWCAPCRMMSPVIESLASELDGRMKIGMLNVDENEQVAARYDIRGVPTVMIFKNGELKEQAVGLASKEYLLGLVEKYV